MALLTFRVCPNACLYIARIDERAASSGGIQPTAQSAAKAIQWAINHKVDIISMCWTIVAAENNMEDLELLEEAVQAARESNILMFSAASN
ncbi:hypothetical protein K440DRAFT_631358 [Wilcoxina mikolae CBS 423.85]|nr:hypothetical protein K440DRAFT_631358 [Wilcoxina mikolae CBS 423.85]